MHAISLTVSRGLRSRTGSLDLAMVRALRFSSAEAAQPVSTSKPNADSTKRRYSKEYLAENVPKEPQTIHDALELVKQFAWAHFDESVDIALNTGLDPRKPNQNIKGMAKLPSGRGKKVRVCVIAQSEDVEMAKQAGADVAGGDEIIQLIQQGDVNFDSVIATPEMMAQVGKIGKILGPRGLMPNPKMGTVTKDVARAVKDAKAGAVQFKTERQGVIHAGLGKVSFTSPALLENVRSFMVSLMDVKPEGFKGRFLLKAYVSSTMGPAIPVDLGTVDPASPRFMLNIKAVTTDKVGAPKK